MHVDLAGSLDAFAAGLGLGAAYCAMLWFAVQHLCNARKPALWIVATAVPRLGLTLGGFYLVMDGRWERLLMCFAGFMVVRVAVQQWMKATSSEGPIGS